FANHRMPNAHWLANVFRPLRANRPDGTCVSDRPSPVTTRLLVPKLRELTDANDEVYSGAH
ncbi:hypothetical protein RFX30_09895, partial [Acinetobacter baumannii]|nr:hypothetical protein [Acinetobacter baumannii]